jgi:hypothetical protein
MLVAVIMAFVIVASMIVVMAFMVMVVPDFRAQVRGIARVRLQIVLEGIARAQRFAFQALSGAETDCRAGLGNAGREQELPFGARNAPPWLPRRANRRLAAWGIPHLMVRGFAGRVKLQDALLPQRAPQKARYCSKTCGGRT